MKNQSQIEKETNEVARLSAEGQTLVQIALELGLTIWQVQSRAKACGIKTSRSKISPETTADIAKAFEAGAPLSGIAEAANLHPRQVRLVLQGLGLIPPSKKRRKPSEWFTEAEIEEFWATTEKQGDCVVWTGSLSADVGYKTPLRYGYCGLLAEKSNSQAYVHRLAYAIITGAPVPKGGTVKRSCGNPLCVNPDHLELHFFKTSNEDETSSKTQDVGVSVGV